MAGPDREKALELALAQIDKSFGKGSVMRLGDEVLTPDSSRFWDAEDYEPGRPQASFDKQFVRDWLTGPDSGWDKTSGEAPPALPADVVAKTRDRYVEAYERLTGRPFDA